MLAKKMVKMRAMLMEEQVEIQQQMKIMEIDKREAELFPMEGCSARLCTMDSSTKP
jgi:hypothetical protein